MSSDSLATKRPRGPHLLALPDFAGWLVILYLPVAIVVMGSQWLLTVPVGSVFFLDPFLLLACLVGAVKIVFHKKWLHRGTLIPVVLLLALPTWASAHLLSSDISLSALREFHPFLVLIWGAIILIMFPQQSERIKRGGTCLLLLALGFHWATVSYRMVSGWMGIKLPAVGEIVLFQSGPHVDGLILGFFSGLLFWRALSANGLRTIGFAITVVVVQTQVALLDNRATILASLVILFVVLATHFLRIGSLGRWKLWTRDVGILLTVLIGSTGLVALLQPATLDSISGSYSYVLYRIDAESGSVSEQLSTQEQESGQLSTQEQESEQHLGSGTVRARLDAWQALTEWLFAEPNRIWAGVGFDSDYLWHSGASKKLLNQNVTIENGNKWAHNHVLTISAILGVPAVLYFVGLCVFAFLRLATAIKNEGDELSVLALVALVGVSVSSLFGVIFENPWGSVPLAWALAIGFSKTFQQEGKNTSGLIEGT